MDAEPIKRKVPSGGLQVRLLTERALARRVAAGDRGAFAELFRRYRQPLYGYCVSILGNQEDSADALQNTMAKALKALPGEKRDLQLKPWLFRVARNECIDLVRSRRPTDEITDEELPSARGVEAEVAGRERLRELLSDLEHLPEKQRSALVMRELNDLSFEEIGEAFDATPGAAKQVVYEARISLQELAEGRTMECEPVREAISARDGRTLRGRRLRAHLRSCDPCKDFKRGIDARGKDFKALMPPVPVAVVAAVIGMINGSGGGGAGFAGLAGLKAAIGGSAAKTATVVAVAATVGAGAVGVVEHKRDSGDRDGHSQSQTPAVVAEPVAGAAGSTALSRAELGGQRRNTSRDDQKDAHGSPSDEGDNAAGGGRGHGPDGTGPPGTAGGSPGNSGNTPGPSENAPGQSENAPGGSGGSKGAGAIPSPGGEPPQLPEAASQGQERAAEAQNQAGPPPSAGKSAVVPGPLKVVPPPVSGKIPK